MAETSPYRWPARGAAAEGVLEQAKKPGARELEASVEDIVVTDDGRVGVSGVPTSARPWLQSLWLGPET